MDLENEIKNTQVVIFAGGMAKRMGNSDLPKALQKVAGKTFLDWCIEFYAKHGFKDFVLLVGHLHEDIENYVTDGSKYGVDIKYSVDPENMNKIGKGKAFKHAIETGKINLNKRAIITYPDDIFLDENLPIKLLKKHLEINSSKGAIATIVCVSGVEYPYGVVLAYEDDLVDEFLEKPILQMPTSTGLLIAEPEIYKIVEEAVDMDSEEAVEFEKVVLPKVVKSRKLSRLVIDSSMWIPVNTQKELESAERILQNKK
jgi:NDP-sugar pyrophosphorylase family protein